MKYIALDYYTKKRLNCAESVANAYKDKNNLDESFLKLFSDCGHGRSPDGTCGALYAACKIADDKQENVKNEFKKHSAGLTACREIRKAKALPCIKCVEFATEILERIMNKEI